MPMPYQRSTRSSVVLLPKPGSRTYSGGHHAQRKQNVAPPLRMVVAGPDAAIPVHPDAGRTGVYQNALVRLQPLESLTCRTGHVITKKIMYLVVPHTPLFGVVVEQLIIVFVVGKLCHHAGKKHQSWKYPGFACRGFPNFSKGLFFSLSSA